MDNDTAADRIYGPEPAAQPVGNTLLGGGLPAAPTTPATSGNTSNPADTLYGGNDLEDQQTVAAADHAPKDSPDSLEDSLYGGEEVAELPIPDDIKQLREADSARKLYSPQGTFSEAIPDSIFDGSDGLESVPKSMQRAVVSELRELAADLGMTNQDIVALRAVGALCNQAKPSPAVLAQWRAEAGKRLESIYGDGAAEAYSDAMRFVGRDPRFMKALETGGRNAHPDAVVLFAKLAIQAKAAGSFK